jgi:hypothetical protein
MQVTHMLLPAFAGVFLLGCSPDSFPEPLEEDSPGQIEGQFFGGGGGEGLPQPGEIYKNLYGNIEMLSLRVQGESLSNCRELATVYGNGVVLRFDVVPLGVSLIDEFVVCDWEVRWQPIFEGKKPDEIARLVMGPAYDSPSFIVPPVVNTYITGAGSQSSPPWALDRVDDPLNVFYDQLYSWNNDGTGVTVYLIETGLRSLAEFGNRIVGREHFLPPGLADGFAGHDCPLLIGGLTDAHGLGHGTAAASVIAGSLHGVAKNAQIYSLQALNCRTLLGHMGAYFSALDRTLILYIQNGGPSIAYTTVIGVPANQALTYRLQALLNAGLQVVSPAGHYSTIFNPSQTINVCTNSMVSNVPGALIVGATTRNGDQQTLYSNWGPCVDLFAPGGQSLDANGNPLPLSELVRLAGLNPAFGNITFGAGSSFAAPAVAGCAARFLQNNPTAPPSAVHSAIVNAVIPNAVQLRPDVLNTGTTGNLLNCPTTW